MDDVQQTDRLRLAVTCVRALVRHFGEATILDALAIVSDTPDGKGLLSAAAEASRMVSASEPVKPQ